jgi:predicted DNA binding CopG/RHH family protein
MKTILDKEEKEILESFENGEWKSVPDIKKRKSQLKEIAKETLKKNRRLNIRISEIDLRHLQRKALHEGLPYQTFVSSILHKFVNGNFKEQATH